MYRKIVPSYSNCSLLFLDWYKTVIWAYVLSLILSCGMLDLGMKKIVLVPSALPGIPWANLPISLPYEWPQISLYLGQAMRCQ
jgi:hypothetical protein